MTPYYIQALDSGYRWNSGQPLETPVTLSYAIPVSPPSYYSTFTAYPTQHYDGIRDALAHIETLTNISFTETASADNSHLAFSYKDLPGNIVGQAYYPSNSQPGNLAGDVFIDTRYQNDQAMAPGSQQYTVLLHELGHALGLEHTFEGVAMPAAEDSHSYSLMSYNWVFGPYHQTFSMYDIATLQHLYGANQSHNAGDTIYDLSDFLGTRQTLWDAGGTDLFDGSLLTQNLNISLEEGSFSDLDSQKSLAIALDVTIENASGGSGSDRITGNAADNVISGNGGSDTIVGGEGNDVMDGGAGTDTLLYDSTFGSFSFLFTSPADLIISAVSGVDWGIDTVFGFEWFQFTDILKTFSELYDEFGIGEPNLRPTALNDGGIGFTTDEDSAFATPSVLANDSDPDGGILSVLSFDTTGTQGQVTDNGDGTFNYDPSGQFESLAAGQSATDSFSYTLSDGQGGTDSATVTVTVEGRDETVPPPSAVLLSDNFDDGDFLGWTVVDEGTVSGPSAWSVVGQEVHQASNIYGFNGSQLDHRDGTTLFWNDAAAQSWQDYTVELSFRSTDDDGIGLVFYYTDTDNYYKVDFDRDRGFSTLFQVKGGVETTLATVSGPAYVIGNTTELAVTVSGSGITVLRDGGDVFGGPVLNGSLTGGTVGLYSWGNTGANFDNVVVTSNGPAAPALSIAATDAIKAEGDLGTTDFTFTVTRAGDTSIATDVLFDVLPGASNPAAATDFGGSFPVNQLVHFDVGATMQIVTVQVSGDADIEANEEFTVQLHSPTAGAVISVDTATGTIQDDDALPSAVLLSDNFDDGDFLGWTVVDEGTVSGPSAWSVVGQEVHQASNIYGFNGSQLDHRDGTTLFWNDAAAQSWQDYTVELSFRSTDDDGIGLVFYYTDTDNYYKVDFDRDRGFSTLFQVKGGVETTLATVSGPAYVIGNTTELAVTVSDNGITVLRDGGDVFGGPVLGGSLTGGTVGLYSWGNTGANFDNVVVTSNGPAAPALSIAATDAIKAEGDLGTTDFTFTVTRAGDTSIATDVLFDVLPGASNPAAATDFGGGFPVNQLVHFDVGATMQIVTVQVSGDADIEANEEFTVQLHSPTAGAVISVDTATGTIQDDDALPSAVLLSDNFDDGDFLGWTVVDEGTVSGPSAWSVVGQEVHQASNIYGFNGSQLDHRDGTTLFWNDAAAQSWQDYTVELSFRSTDDDGIGLVFYYTDTDNYYKVDFDRDRGFSTLFQVKGGVETTLATVSGPAYAIGSTTELAVTVSDNGITVLRDGGDVFGGPVLNGSLTGGTVGLYSWGNTGANFDNVVVTSNSIGDDLIVGTTGDNLIDFNSGQSSYTPDYHGLTAPIIVDLGLADAQNIKGAEVLLDSQTVADASPKPDAAEGTIDIGDLLDGYNAFGAPGDLFDPMLGASDLKGAADHTASAVAFQDMVMLESIQALTGEEQIENYAA